MISLVKRFFAYIRWLYMQYLLNTGLYMLEPSETKLFNTFIILLIVTSVYSTYMFLPTQIMRIIGYLSQSTTAPGQSAYTEM